MLNEVQRRCLVWAGCAVVLMCAAWVLWVGGGRKSITDQADPPFGEPCFWASILLPFGVAGLAIPFGIFIWQSMAQGLGLR